MNIDLSNRIPYNMSEVQALAFLSLDPYLWAWKNANILDEYFEDEIPYFVRQVLNSQSDIEELQFDIKNNTKLFQYIITKVLNKKN